MRHMYSWYLETPRTDELYVYYEKALNPEECKQVIELGLDPNITVHETPAVSSGDGWRINSEVRKGRIGWIKVLPETEWLFRRVTDLINGVNKQFFNYDLLNIENFQFTEYTDNSDFYGPHIDMMHRANATRKLSFSIQLSEPDSYEGGELVLHYGKSGETMDKKQGTSFFFPSWTLHEVTPVTKGTRYSLVGWVNGPRFR